MENFELCYSISADSILIPQLLPVAEPEFPFDYSGSLRFALYHTDFLPPSVFPRFMVKVHKDIKEETCWRTGVLLKDMNSGTQAVVKADIETRRINIWVQGERRREYLHYLRYLLADINSSFEKLTVSERVPMPDNPHITADYETLLKYAEHGIDSYVPEGSGKVYNIRELLGLVQPKNADELAGLMRKVSAHLDEKESSAEISSRLLELNPNIFGVSFNLNEAFKRILAWQKQRQQQPRK
jgi:hypothetical protein